MENTAEFQALCAEYLGGKWQSFRDEIRVKHLDAGFANRTYRCSLDTAEPSDVVVKLFGSEFTSNISIQINGVACEAVICEILYKEGIGPKLLAAFDDGRIEEFISGRNVTTDDFLTNTSLLSTLAKILVKYHTQNSMPVSKNIVFHDKMIYRFCALEPEVTIDDYCEDKRNHFRNLLDFPLKDEIDWVLKNAQRIKSKLVFSHHDVHPGNIILKDTTKCEDNPLVLLDYELSGYDYRGFDIGYFFLFLGLRVCRKSEKTTVQYTDDLSGDIEKMFIQSYIDALRATKDFNEDLDTYDHLLTEARYFHLLALLTMLGYGKRWINATYWNHLVESFAYLTDLMNSYRRKKREFLKMYSNIFTQSE